MTKKNIIDIAIKEFSYYGYEGLSMSKLASKLGLTKPAIYYHFRDKQSLYEEVLKNLGSNVNNKIKDIINSDLDPKDKFREYIKIELDSIREHPEVVSISLREMASYVSNIDDKTVNDFEEDINLLISILKSLNLKDKYKNIDLSIIKALILGTINTYYVMHMSEVKLEPMEDYDNNKNMIFDSLEKTIADIVLDALCKDK